MRREHLLGHNRNTSLPHEYIFVDTETKGTKVSDCEEEHHLWFGYAVYHRIRTDSSEDNREVYYIEDETSFWDWVESKCRRNIRLWVFAHNMSYDFRILHGFTQLQQRGWTMGIPIFDRLRFLIKYRKGDVTIMVSDTMNYFTVSLAQLGDSIGFTKLKMPTTTDDIEEWKPYCLRDVEVIERVILDFREFVDSEDLGNWGVTAARQALNAFQHRFRKHPIEIHANEAASNLEIECYHGGRVEAFRIGKIPWTPVYKLDVNSMYPYVMKTQDYPTSLLEYIADISPAKLIDAMRNVIVLGYCEIDTDEPVYCRTEDGKLTFPIGRFGVHLTHPEIEYAIQQGHLIRLIEGYVYRRHPIFTDYVDYFYAKRKHYKKSNNLAFDLFCKMMLNSLYGKFGQRVPETVAIGKAPEGEATVEYHFDIVTGERWREIAIGGIRYKEGERRLSYNSFPAIAACVTGYARVYLWRLIKEAGTENVAYVDTDSLLVNEEGYKHLSYRIDPDKLGMLKLEDKGIEAVVMGLKDYRVDETIHIKGVKPDSPEIEQGVYQVQQVPGIRTNLLRNEHERVVFVKMQKRLSRDYDKGVIMADGRVEPFILNERIHAGLTIEV